MNETYEWLFTHYALPLMQVEKSSDEIQQAILACGDQTHQLFLRDQINSLCVMWGTDAFTVGLQLGIRLMAEQRAGGWELS